MTENLPMVDHELTFAAFKEIRNNYGNPFWAHRTLQNGTQEKVLAYRCTDSGRIAYINQGQK